MKKFFCAILAVFLIALNAAVPILSAGMIIEFKPESSFSDMKNDYWALPYIVYMQEKNIINGYPDGTFRPDVQVKVSEYLKMLCMAIWPDFKYVKSSPSSHWAQPYVDALDKFILTKNDYTTEKLNSVITREEASKLICLFMMIYTSTWNANGQLHGVTLEKEQEYISDFTDESLITDEKTRIYIDNCIRMGIINGFEDGTFRPFDGLTRAQASKILYTALNYKG